MTVILARALARINGLDVHLVTLEKNLSAELMEHDGKVTIHRLPRSSCPEIIDIHIGPGRKRLLAKIKEIAPDIVHSHETFGLTLGDLEIPHVFTVHGFDHANIPAEGRRFANIRSFLWKHVEHYGLAKHKTIISISPYVRDMIEQYAPQAKIYDIDNPVDDSYFSVERTEDNGRVLILGWINERKNTLGAVKALAYACECGADGMLAVAGEAKVESYRQLIMEEIKKKNLSAKVVFLGHINRNQLKEELARTSVLLLPSLQENAPMAISEAMAAGIPVIASNRCGMPFMVAHGKSGYLIDPTDIAQIGERLKELLQSKEQRQKMGSEGRIIARSRFHPDVVAQKTYAVYASLLKK
ncbi:MAG: glycosyltransferase family 4 protein [Chlorobium sp.]|nr:glycosyltransferase family 4 protein [Chlorobium sp.]